MDNDFQPPVHDHFDGSAHCVECGGPCQLDSRDMALTALIRFLFDGELRGPRINYMGESQMRRMGIDVDLFRKRAYAGFESTGQKGKG